MEFRRRREKKTDYKQRLALLKSRKPRLVVRRSNNGFRMQVIIFEPSGDKTVLEVCSSSLRKFGWNGHLGDMPSGYLTGLLIGSEALNKNIGEVVPDLGMQMAVRGSSLYACLAGAKDSGLKLNIGKDALPNKDRIEGKHIAQYAKLLKEDKAKYARHFSNYVKNNMDPERLPEHFQDVKNSIISKNRKKGA